MRTILLSSSYSKFMIAPTLKLRRSLSSAFDKKLGQLHYKSSMQVQEQSSENAI